VRTDELVGAGGGAHLSPSGIGDVEVAVWDIDSVIGAAAPYGEVVLKLDCEGGEYEIIDAITDWPPIRVLVMEWHGPGMPHLGHIDEARWGPMVQRLAEHGITTIDGKPHTGGLIWCRRYKY
jgi:hypothetical protein